MRFDTDQLTDLLEVTAQATNLYVPAVISGTSRFALYGKQGEKRTFGHWLLRHAGGVPAQSIPIPLNGKALHVGKVF